MRVKREGGALTVHAMSGTHVVLLGMNMTKSAARGLLGFAIMREEKATGARIWLRGMKAFETTEPRDGLGESFSSLEHPIQSFQWSDYSAKPGQRYAYRVIAMRGKPGALRRTDTVSIPITTEEEVIGTHAVFFNRGAAASQEYARRFQNKKPSEVGQAAYTWLSRGLVEALLAFIAKAKDSSFGIHAAVYEFENQLVMAALKKAKSRGAVVKVIYDAAGAKTDNEKSIAAAKIKTLTVPRTNAKIAHNKFFVLTKQGVPTEVWTGSTNLTENGIYGHSNLGHIIRDKEVAAAFLAYWHELKGDPERKGLSAWTSAHPITPIEPVPTGTTAIFSPRSGLSALDWYAEIARAADRGLFMTFAFGMNERFVSVYERQDAILRYALMEKKGMTKEQAAEIDRVRKLPNVTVAVGARVEINRFDRWLAEITKIDPGAHVLYVHTKYMLVDPLGDDPIVVTGSANFSKAGTDTNDENMLVIRGNKQVADIYLGEFMRLFTHYAFREWLSREKTTPQEKRPLSPTDAWLDQGYYQPGTDRALRRVYFAGG